jgi:hypothetical protein
LGAACTQIERAIGELGGRNRIVGPEQPSCNVDIYYHKRGLTQEQAKTVATGLDRNGVKSRLLEHAFPSAPDAVFVGGYVRAAEARLVLGLVPYDVKYLFRPDYPESEGGDSAGLKIGLGYTSAYNADTLSSRSKPARITKSQFAELIDPENTDTEFQCLLHRLTKSYETG